MAHEPTDDPIATATSVPTDCDPDGEPDDRPIATVTRVRPDDGHGAGTTATHAR